MVTAFEKRAYMLCKNIPKGKVCTYKMISDKTKSSPRAVGGALSKNPYAPEIPCHRVVRSDGEIGGFMGSKNNRKKITLLRKEGIIIKKGKIEKEYFIKNQI